MNQVIGLWKIKEVKRLKKLISKKENLITLYAQELYEIKKEKQLTIKDFGILINKYGNPKYNQSMIVSYYKSLNFIKNNDISEDKYRHTAIF